MAEASTRQSGRPKKSLNYAVMNEEGLQAAEATPTENNPEMLIEDYDCLRSRVWNTTRGNPCDCYQACRESRYETDLSFNTWPAENKWDDLLKTVCDKFGEDSTDCVQLSQETDVEWALRRNFLKVNVFYEDLSYELVEQKPNYEIAQFASDVGGVFGLWIGASILSLCEVCDVLFSIFMTCCHSEDKSKNDKRRRRRAADSEEGAHSGINHMRSEFQGMATGQYQDNWGQPPAF